MITMSGRVSTGPAASIAREASTARVGSVCCSAMVGWATTAGGRAAERLLASRSRATRDVASFAARFALLERRIKLRIMSTTTTPRPTTAAKNTLATTMVRS